MLIEQVFEVRGNTLTTIEAHDIYAGSANGDDAPHFTVRFIFAAPWDAGTVTASFTASGASIIQQLGADGRCSVPSECMAHKGTIGVGLFAANRIVTNVQSIIVRRGAQDGGLPPAPPTPDVYAQIVDKMDAALDASRQAVSKSEQAIGQVESIAGEALEVLAESREAVKDASAATGRALEAVQRAEKAAEEAEQVIGVATEAKKLAEAANEAAEDAVSMASDGIARADAADGKAEQALTDAAEKYVKPSDGIPESDLSQEVQGKLNAGGEVSDVTVEGISCVENGEAKIPIRSDLNYGLKLQKTLYGHLLTIKPSPTWNIGARNGGENPITATNYDYAVKCAMTDGKGAAWAGAEKKAGRERLGIYAMTQEEYNLLVPDENTIYLIVEA